MLTVPVYNPRLQPARQRGLDCAAVPVERAVACSPCQAAFDPFCGAGVFVGAARKALAGKILVVVNLQRPRPLGKRVSSVFKRLTAVTDFSKSRHRGLPKATR